MSGGAFVPAWILHDPTISPQAKLIAGRIFVLCQRDGYCWASNSFFAEEFGVSERTIQRWIDELDGRHFQRELAPGPSGWDRKLWPIFRGDKSVTSEVTPGVVSEVTNLSPEYREELREESIQSVLSLQTPPPPKASRDDFEALWALAPGRGSKKRAWPEYQKVVPSKVSAEDILEARAAHVDRASDMRYVKHLERWIRDERWVDVEAARVRTGPFEYGRLR